MRQFQIVLVVVFAQDQVAEQQNVEVESARAISGPGGAAVAAKLLLNAEQAGEQLARSKSGFKPHHRIQKMRLIGKSDGRRGIKRGTRNHAAQLRQPLPSRRERRLRRTSRAGQVCAESDVRNGHPVFRIALRSSAIAFNAEQIGA